MNFRRHAQAPTTQSAKLSTCKNHMTACNQIRRTPLARHQHRRLLMTFIVVLALIGSAISQEPSVVLTDLSGVHIEGTLETIEFEKVGIQTGERLEQIGFENIDSLDFGFAPAARLDGMAQIHLLDGSELNAKSISILSRVLSIELMCGELIQVNSGIVDSVRFKSYKNELALGKQWREILDDESRAADAIVVNRSGELDAVEGIVGDLSGDKLTFSIEDRTARVALEKLDAILFYHASDREFGLPVCEIVLADRSKVRAKSLQWNDSRLVCIGVGGAKFEFRRQALRQLDFSLGKSLTLSSMTPTTNDWQSLMTSSAIFEKLRKIKLARINESYSGQPLSLKFQPDTGISYLAKVKQFNNGFAMQGGGKLAFALDGQYEKLTGSVGFDPAANASGNVRFKVSLDGKVVLDQEMIHRTMKNPIELDLIVKDAKRVVFEIDYNDGRSTGDQIHLVDLKVSQ